MKINTEIVIFEDVQKNIIAQLSRHNSEFGGIIGSVEAVICSFFMDLHPFFTSKSRYSPNIDVLNDVINNEWASNGIHFVGFVHSHYNNSELSENDVLYIRQVMKYSELKWCIAGIVNLENKSICWYYLTTDHCFKTDVLLI